MVFVQLVSEKTETTLKRTGFVAYPVHAILLDLSVRTRQWVK